MANETPTVESSPANTSEIPEDPKFGSKRWQDILDEVREAQRPIQENGYPVWFRGQSDSRWVLRSGLHRHVLNCLAQIGVPHEQSWAIDMLRDIYITLYAKFKGRAWRFLDHSERSPLGDCIRHATLWLANSSPRLE